MLAPTMTAPAVDSSLLDSSIEGIRIQFSFSNKDASSAWLWSAEADTLAKRKERKVREVTTGGVQFIPPTENISLVQFLRDMQSAVYVMTDGTAQERPHPKMTGQWYLMNNFIFHKMPLATPTDPVFVPFLHQQYEPALERLVREAMWRVRAYRNPLPRPNGAILYGMSINCEVRQPYLNSVGEKVVRWQRDEKGEKIGEKALPIKPDKHLRIIENRIVLE